MSDVYSDNINGSVDSEDIIAGTVAAGLSNRIIIPFATVTDFPLTGKANALYIDKSAKPNIAYRWDHDELAYVMVGGAGGNGSVSLDTTLTVSGSAADSAAVGAALNSKSSIGHSHTAAEIGADVSGAAASAVSAHNVSTTAHDDIRLLFEGLSARLNAIADSDDTTLDQLSEIVAYIQANRGLIDSVTTAKVNVSDIIDNLETNVSNKPLSAAQGVEIKALIEALTELAYVGDSEEEANASGRRVWLYPLDIAGIEYVTAESLAAYVKATTGKVLLYSGSLAVGDSATLDGLEDFDELKVYVDGVLNPCTLQVDHINGIAGGGGNYLNSENVIINRAIEGTVSGNTFTYTKTYIYNTKSAAHASSSAKISKIYGVPSR